MSDIREWLEELGLGQYAEAFAENAIDLETLPHVSDADLKDLGVALGHRRTLQAAVAALPDNLARTEAESGSEPQAAHVEDR